jgi:hypothetical protein
VGVQGTGSKIGNASVGLVVVVVDVVTGCFVFFVAVVTRKVVVVTATFGGWGVARAVLGGGFVARRSDEPKIETRSCCA